MKVNQEAVAAAHEAFQSKLDESQIVSGMFFTIYDSDSKGVEAVCALTRVDDEQSDAAMRENIISLLEAWCKTERERFQLAQSFDIEEE